MIQAERVPDTTPPEPVTDSGILEAYLEDASGAPPGRAAALLRVTGEQEAAAWLRRTAPSAVPVLFQAARTSLTGGAIPRDEVVLSVERMCDIGAVEQAAGPARVTAGPGVRLEDLQCHLEERGWYFPPVPTYQQAMLGGVTSTNAGGAATFKYGVTRDWVHGLRVLLFNGDLLRVERGQAVARPGERFRIRLSDGSTVEVPTPAHRLPDLKKISAGYYASDPLDLVDLFVGSEGTLGLITAVTIDLVPQPGSVVTGMAFVATLRAALDLAGELRREAEGARRSCDPLGPDVRSIEFLDDNCLRLLREVGADRTLRVRIPESSEAALLFEMELPEQVSNDDAQAALAAVIERQEPAWEGPLVRLFRILERHGALEDLEFAFPQDADRRHALNELRETVPRQVLERLAQRARRDPEVKKVGGDLIVPFERVPEMMELYREGFVRRELPFAIWGHLSDGNLHPNAIARSGDEVRLGYEALLEFADHAARLGGCPLSEHGVGRSSVKQKTLRRFVGGEAIRRMREIKRALDPPGRIARDVLFPFEPAAAPGSGGAG